MLRCITSALVDTECARVLRENIVPEYENLVNRDAACEVAGFYSDKDVKEYVSFLRKRLECLQAVCALANMK